MLLYFKAHLQLLNFLINMQFSRSDTLFNPHFLLIKLRVLLLSSLLILSDPLLLYWGQLNVSYQPIRALQVLHFQTYWTLRSGVGQGLIVGLVLVLLLLFIPGCSNALPLRAILWVLTRFLLGNCTQLTNHFPNVAPFTSLILIAFQHPWPLLQPSHWGLIQVQRLVVVSHWSVVFFILGQNERKVRTALRGGLGLFDEVLSVFIRIYSFRSADYHLFHVVSNQVSVCNWLIHSHLSAIISIGIT